MKRSGQRSSSNGGENPGATGISPEARFSIEILGVLGLALIAVWAVTRWVAVPWLVEGDSMSPALLVGDRVLIDLWSYRHRDPRPGEVALVLGPEDLPLVKRVGAASPRAGTGEGDTGTSFQVLGDNRRQSLDSRAFGPIRRSRFVGRVLWRYWPPSRMGPVR